MPQFTLAVATLFAFTLAFLYLRYPVDMWIKILRPAFGGVVISGSTGKRISYFIGGFAAIFGSILLVIMALSLTHMIRA